MVLNVLEIALFLLCTKLLDNNLKSDSDMSIDGLDLCGLEPCFMLYTLTLILQLLITGGGCDHHNEQVQKGTVFGGGGWTQSWYDGETCVAKN